MVTPNERTETASTEGRLSKLVWGVCAGAVVLGTLGLWFVAAPPIALWRWGRGRRLQRAIARTIGGKALLLIRYPRDLSPELQQQTLSSTWAEPLGIQCYVFGRDGENVLYGEAWEFWRPQHKVSMNSGVVLVPRRGRVRQWGLAAAQGGDSVAARLELVRAELEQLHL
jgi:hypothetical protein